MALGGTQMSNNTQTPTISLSDTFPTATSQNNDGGGGSSGTRGANYFFGFLITFVVLLLIFIGCGIGSRRRFLARRPNATLGGFEPWGPLSKDGSEYLRKPELYEKVIGEPVMEDQWRYTMPLSVTLMRQSKDAQLLEDWDDLESQQRNSIDHDNPTDTINNNISPTTPTTQSHSAHNSFVRELHSWMPSFHDPKRDSHTTEDEKEIGRPELLDVAVMIAMPSPPHSSFADFHDNKEDRPSSSCTNESHIPNYQIGTTSVPWHSELVMGPSPDPSMPIR